MSDLGWIAAAFLCGALLKRIGIKHRNPASLKSRFAATDRYRGMRYDDILHRVKTLPQSTTISAEGRTFRTWGEAGYSITLEFDSDSVCLGVEDERM